MRSIRKLGGLLLIFGFILCSCKNPNPVNNHDKEMPVFDERYPYIWLNITDPSWRLVQINTKTSWIIHTNISIDYLSIEYDSTCSIVNITKEEENKYLNVTKETFGLSTIKIKYILDTDIFFEFDYYVYFECNC